jgi:hypothetical protein
MQGPLPVKHYHGTLRLRPITDENHSDAEWLSEFDVAAEMETEEDHSLGRCALHQSNSPVKLLSSIFSIVLSISRFT